MNQLRAQRSQRLNFLQAVLEEDHDVARGMLARSEASDHASITVDAWDGEFLCMVVLSSNRLEPLRLLLEYGARRATTGEARARMLRCLEGALFQENLTGDTINLLLSHGVDVNTQNGTALVCALATPARVDRTGVLALLRAGADPNRWGDGPREQSPSSLRLAVHVCHETGAFQVMRALLKAGARPDGDAVGDAHDTPLRTAASLDDDDIFALLLTHGAALHDPIDLAVDSASSESSSEMSVARFLMRRHGVRREAALVRAQQRNEHLAAARLQSNAGWQPVLPMAEPFDDDEDDDESDEMDEDSDEMNDEPDA